MLDDKVSSVIFDSEKKDAENSFFKYKVFLSFSPTPRNPIHSA